MTHRINNWHRPNHVKAIQTTSSLSHFQSFDIHPDHAVPESIKLLSREFELPHAPKFLLQNHGNQVIEYSHSPESQFGHQADACFTRCEGVICAVMTADCLPVLLTDTIGSFVAAVHCGWRSLYANIISKTLNQINPESQLHAWLGPCIQQPQYEVDEAFVDHYLKTHPDCESAFTAIKAGKSHACLYTLASVQLKAYGVECIEADGQCTLLDENYHSWRQSKTTKRMATMVWLDSPPACQ